MIVEGRIAAARVFQTIAHSVVVLVGKRIGNRDLQPVEALPSIRHPVAVRVRGGHGDKLIASGNLLEAHQIVATRSEGLHDVAVGPFVGDARGITDPIPAPRSGSIRSGHELESIVAARKQMQRELPAPEIAIPHHARPLLILRPQVAARHMHDSEPIRGVRQAQAGVFEQIQHLVIVGVRRRVIGERIETEEYLPRVRHTIAVTIRRSRERIDRGDGILFVEADELPTGQSNRPEKIYVRFEAIGFLHRRLSPVRVVLGRPDTEFVVGA